MSAYTVDHLFGPPGNDGGGTGSRIGTRRRLDDALDAGIVRLTRTMDPSPHDRILIHRRGGEHPTWLYRDGDGRVCMWRKHPSERLDCWGYVS